MTFVTEAGLDVLAGLRDGSIDLALDRLPAGEEGDPSLFVCDLVQERPVRAHVAGRSPADQLQREAGAGEGGMIALAVEELVHVDVHGVAAGGQNDALDAGLVEALCQVVTLQHARSCS